MKTKCYNAGKIGDLPETLWKRKFQDARAEIAAMGHLVVCPTLLQHAHKRTWLDYMREDLQAMLKCDFVYAQRDWEDSPGATIEINLAKQLGIPVIYQP